MAFNNFTLQSAQEQFGLILKTNEALFPGVRPVDAGATVHATLETLGQLARSVNTEKARSEWLIAPILGELWIRARSTIWLLSGVDFTVDKDAGLTAVVDFLIGKGPQVSFITAPILREVCSQESDARTECRIVRPRSRATRLFTGHPATKLGW